MNVQFGPNSIDEPNLLYKLQRKLKVFETGNSLTNRGYSLVACSSKYGLVFIGSPIGTLSVYHLKDLVDKECEPQCMILKLPERPTHVAVNCDYELLAVTGGAVLCIYKVVDFQTQNVSPVVSIKTDVSPSTFVSSLQWNPCIPDTISIAFYDGTLLVSQVTSGQVKKVQSKARCICWSPKGKQLVTGNSDGTLCQYKPDLTPAKMVPTPDLFSGSPVEAMAIYWISTFQFAVVYKNATDNSRPSVTIVNTPKAGQPTCLNYEDICYSLGNSRPWYYYLIGLAQWNIILSSSSNSMEIATLASLDGANWMQWCQTDEARPELPLTNKKIENYPVGVSVDTCAIHQLPWGENETLPHMPLLHVVSQSGLLTVFNMINLRKDAPQVCAPPQQISLPAAVMTSAIPNDLPPPAASAPEPVPSKIQEPPQPQQSASPFSFAPSQPPVAQNAPMSFAASQPPLAQNAPISFAASQHSLAQNAKPFSFQSAAPLQGITATSTAAPTPPVTEKKQVESKPILSIPQPQTPPPIPKPASESKPASQAQEVNAALKAEQERMNKLKADQELRNMLVKEINDFQMELYKFAVKTREVQIKLQKDIESLEPSLNFQSIDAEKLKKDCAVEELRSAVMALKLELVRACAFVAEARAHAEAKDLPEWTQADPLTLKRVASVKKLAYYVQNQLDQAHKALDYKWNEMTSNNPKYNKPGQYMIRPVLDDVYQPLVRQQEILSRQQAVLRTLKNTLKECDTAPMFKSTSLLRSTPFKNKDPLSKLTKNILNMSIDPQTKKEPPLSAQKLDALRDMLSNHRPAKIKPASIEIQQHLAGMRLNYEKSVKEKALVAQERKEQKVEVLISQKTVQPKPEPQPVAIQPQQEKAFVVPKPDLITKQPPMPAPSFTPVNMMKPAASSLSNVARTLFTDEPKSEPIKSPSVQSTPQPKFSFAPQQLTQSTASANNKSVLKDMLQKKMPNAEAKNDANTFMGQKICSPSAFAASTPISQAQNTVTLTSKPLTDINNMFSKFTSQSFAPESKPSQSQQSAAKTTTTKNNLEPAEVKTPEKQEEKITNLFRMKSSTANVPDVLKTNIPSTTAKSVVKPEKVPETSKENIPEKVVEVPTVKEENEKKDESKEVTVTATFKLPSKPAPVAAAASTVNAETRNTEEKPAGLSITVAKPNASSLFAAANAASPTAEKPSLFGSPSSPTSLASSVFATPKPDVATAPDSTKPVSGETSTEAEATKSAFGSSATSPSFLFGSAASSQATTKTQSGSIFSSTPAFANLGSTFGTTTTQTTSTTSAGSLFSPSTTQSSSVSTEAKSLLGAPEIKPTVFSTPTPASPSALFAAASAAVTTQSAFSSSTSSLFAPATSTQAFGPPGSPSAASVFTGANTAPSTGLFSAPTTTSQSLFGTPTTQTQSAFGVSTTASPATVFGSSPSTTQASIFGGSATSTAQSVFGGAATAPAFGAPATTQAFGAPATTQAFGASAPQPSTNLFGTSTPAFASSAQSVFGSTPAPTVFGSSQAATVFGGAQANAFGSPPATTTAGGSLFGTNETNLFASASISTTSAPSPTSGGSIFGGGASPSSPGSVFGSSSQTNVFGGKAAFGQTNPSAAAIFGGGGATAFGQKPATSIWGGGNNNASGGFGSTGFGQQATTQASSLFGGGSGGSFSSPSGGAFGSPSGGSVFGSPQQQTAPAFGGSPAFGSKPAFGQPAGFGTPPSGGFGGFGGLNKSPGGGFGAPAAFGGAAAFGAPAFGSTSPSKMFGGGGASPGFGAPTQSNATFESLATQNTLTFGNLAQHSPPQAQPAPAFNPSPSFTGWRG